MAKERVYKVEFTPYRYPLTFTVGERTISEPFITGLKQRLDGRDLNKAQDEDYLKGVASVFSLRYAHDLLKLVQENTSVKMTITEIVEDNETKTKG